MLKHPLRAPHLPPGKVGCFALVLSNCEAQWLTLVSTPWSPETVLLWDPSHGPEAGGGWHSAWSPHTRGLCVSCPESHLFRQFRNPNLSLSHFSVSVQLMMAPYSTPWQRPAQQSSSLLRPPCLWSCPLPASLNSILKSIALFTDFCPFKIKLNALT